MAPPGAWVSLAAVATLVHRDPQGLVPWAPLVTKDKLDSQGPQEPLGCQVPRVKQEKPSPCPVLRGPKAFPGPLVSKDPKAIGASLEVLEALASLGRRVLWASLASGSLGLRAPKVWTAYLERQGPLGTQAARASTACLVTLVCQAQRASPGKDCRASKVCLASLGHPARQGRREASGDLASPVSMEPSARLACRASEVTRVLPDCRVPKALLDSLEWAPLE